MDCPKCDGAQLEAIEVDEVEVDRCGACAGIWFDPSELGRLLDDRLMAILPHTDERGARTAAERLLKAARKLTFEAGGNPIRVTLSIGLATYADENTMFFDSLVQAAEKAHAQAARDGGDRILVGDPAPAGGRGGGGAPAR